MSTSFKRLFLLLATSVVFLPTSARADRRAFVHTYEYMTMPSGALELEFYNTQSRDSFDEASVRSFESQIEVEYGITDRWDISLYQTFRQFTDPENPDANSPFGYAKTKVRTRYRFAERGHWPVDTLLYFEVGRAFAADAWELEPKLVLARDFGKSTVSLNLVPEVELEQELEGTEYETELEFEPGWALGATYEVSQKLKLGAEWFGEIKSPFDGAEVETWLGPSFSWAPSGKVWAAANAGFGLTGDSADFVARFIVGIGL